MDVMIERSEAAGWQSPIRPATQIDRNRGGVDSPMSHVNNFRVERPFRMSSERACCAEWPWTLSYRIAPDTNPNACHCFLLLHAARPNAAH